jgi:hypothetical protein
MNPGECTAELRKIAGSLKDNPNRKQLIAQLQKLRQAMSLGEAQKSIYEEAFGLVKKLKLKTKSVIQDLGTKHPAHVTMLALDNDLSGIYKDLHDAYNKSMSVKDIESNILYENPNRRE